MKLPDLARQKYPKEGAAVLAVNQWLAHLVGEKRYLIDGRGI